MKRTVGIYSITNIINNKIYIGQSVEIEQRWKRHKRELNQNKHINEYLQRSWNKYGEDLFVFEIIEKCDVNELDDKERFWIKYHKSNNYIYGYNLDDGGRVGKKVNKDIVIKQVRYRKYAVGEDVKNSCLSNIDVFNIKEMIYISNLTINEVADKFNVPNYIVRNIVVGKSYKNVVTPYDNDLKIRFINNKRKPNRKLTYSEVYQIKNLLCKGELSQNQIADMYNVQRHMISAIKACKKYAYVEHPKDNYLINSKQVKKNMSAKELTINQVKEIKKLLAENNITQVRIAEIYNVNRSAIQKIKNLTYWQYVSEDFNEVISNLNCRDGENNRISIIKNEDVILIKKDLAFTTLTSKEIASKYNVSIGLIQDIKHFRAWKHIKTEYDEMIIKKYKEKDEEYINKIIKIKTEIANTDKTILSLSKEYKIGRGLVTKISQLESYSDIASEYNEKIKEKLGDTNSRKEKVTQDKVIEIKKQLATTDITVKEISEKEGISYYIIQSIWLGKTWLNIASEYNSMIFNRNNSKHFKLVS